MRLHSELHRDKAWLEVRGEISPSELADAVSDLLRNSGLNSAGVIVDMRDAALKGNVVDAHDMGCSLAALFPQEWAPGITFLMHAESPDVRCVDMAVMVARRRGANAICLLDDDRTKKTVEVAKSAVLPRGEAVVVAFPHQKTRV